MSGRLLLWVGPYQKPSYSIGKPTQKVSLQCSLMLTLFGVFWPNLFRFFLTSRKRKESELNEPFLKAEKGSLLFLVGRSAGFNLDGIRENQAEMWYRCRVPQIRPTKMAIASVLESPLVIADRQLLLSM